MFSLREIAGPFSDCTSVFEVILDREYTVRDFINAVLSNGEHGCIEIKGSSLVCEYHGSAIKSGAFPDDVLQEKVLSAKAYGGWSLMDYELVL